MINLRTGVAGVFQKAFLAVKGFPAGIQKQVTRKQIVSFTIQFTLC